MSACTVFLLSMSTVGRDFSYLSKQKTIPKTAAKSVAFLTSFFPCSECCIYCCTVVKFLVSDWEIKLTIVGIGWSYRPAIYVAWRAITTTLCHSRLYPACQGLRIGPLICPMSCNTVVFRIARRQQQLQQQHQQQHPQQQQQHPQHQQQQHQASSLRPYPPSGTNQQRLYQMSSSHDDEEEEHFGLDSFPDYMDFQGSVDEDYEDLLRMSHYRRGKCRSNHSKLRTAIGVQ
jgi:hypothetical protein